MKTKAKKRMLLCGIVVTIVIAVLLGPIHILRIKQPPALYITYKEDESSLKQNATIGTYSWKTFFYHINACSESPADIEKRGRLSSFNINSAECEITLDFVTKPNTISIEAEPIYSTLTENAAPTIIDPNTYSLIVKPNYIYSVTVQYDRGNVLYAFSTK